MKKIGEADDAALADGRSVFGWKHALDFAGEWFARVEDGGVVADDFRLTVQDVVEAHIAERDSRTSERVARKI